MQIGLVLASDCRSRCNGKDLAIGTKCFAYDFDTLNKRCYIFKTKSYTRNTLGSVPNVDHYVKSPDCTTPGKPCDKPPLFPRKLLIALTFTMKPKKTHCINLKLGLAGACSGTFTMYANRNGLGGVQQDAGVNTAIKCQAICLASAITCYAYDFDSANRCYVFTDANYKLGTGVATGVNHYKRTCTGAL